MIGRRLPVVEGVYFPPKLQAGEYYGPVSDPRYYGGKPVVWFKLPIDTELEKHFGLRLVASPPHVFIEEPDGSLTIRESILSTGNDNRTWHGYLTKGEWSEC